MAIAIVELCELFKISQDILVSIELLELVVQVPMCGDYAERDVV